MQPNELQYFSVVVWMYINLEKMEEAVSKLFLLWLVKLTCSALY